MFKLIAKANRRAKQVFARYPYAVSASNEKKTSDCTIMVLLPLEQISFPKISSTSCLIEEKAMLIAISVSVSLYKLASCTCGNVKSLL